MLFVLIKNLTFIFFIINYEIVFFNIIGHLKFDGKKDNA